MGTDMLTVTSRALQQLAALLLERAGLKITPDGYHSLRLALSTRMPYSAPVQMWYLREVQEVDGKLTNVVIRELGELGSD